MHPVNRKFTPATWANLATALLFLFVSDIMGGALNRNKTKKIERATKTINKNKKKLSKVLRNSKIQKRTINIEQRFYALGVRITFSFNISNNLIKSIIDRFIK